MSAAAESPDTPDVSIVIACYNEAPHLEESVLEIVATLDRTRWTAELVFVEDCSTDATREVLARVIHKHGERMPMRAILHERNTGRGRTVTDGIRAARGRVVGYLDIDLEVHARYIPSLVRAIEEGADAAIAHRVYHVSLTPTFLLRHLLSRGYRWLSRQMLDLEIMDTEAGFKFFERSKVLPILEECQDPGWFWDTEVMALARLHDLKVVEVPCLFLRRGDKRSTLRVIPATIDYVHQLWSFRRRLQALRAAKHRVTRAGSGSGTGPGY